jgi:hypothetical protein
MCDYKYTLYVILFQLNIVINKTYRPKAFCLQRLPKIVDKEVNVFSKIKTTK